MMRHPIHLVALAAAFIIGGLASMGAGAFASAPEEGSALPTPIQIGNLYGFTTQDSYKGCLDFAEYDDPHGFCLDQADLADGESSLLGRAITGHEMTPEELAIAAKIIQVQNLRQSGASDSAIAAAEELAGNAAADWWQQTYGQMRAS